jgi:O-Antigen ligase/Transcription termination factor nusG
MPEDTFDHAKWYALTVRYQHEQRTEKALQSKGLETLVPVYRSRRQWSDRVKNVELPLFAGYVLCRFALAERIPVLDTPGVAKIVGFGGTAVALEDCQIADIQRLLASKLALAPWPYLRPGDRVRVEHGVASVVAYYTSPGKIFWFFESPYPDVWGPFLSRNNFAQFLELALPVSLWLGCRACRSRRGTLYLWMSASILACGLVSASRAGAVVLILEAALVFRLARPPSPRRLIPVFALGVIALAALAGGEVLVHRFHDSDPFRDRREIFQSSLAMIAARPWTGYGLGNFSTVYPEFARFDPGAVVEHAHNDWLEWATEGGWPYAAVWMLLAISVTRPALRSVWGIGVPAVFVHALVDYPFARFGVAAWLFILAGALESGGRQMALPKGRFK